MKLLVGAALVAFVGVTAPAMAQTEASAAAPAAPAAEAKPQGVRIKCKDEAVTGSFTRKARQCRHAVGEPLRAHAAKAPAASVAVAPATTPVAEQTPAQ